MRRRRNGQCSLCGAWLAYDEKGRKCGPCKAPVVREARKVVRAHYRNDREERVIDTAEERAA